MGRKVAAATLVLGACCVLGASCNGTTHFEVPSEYSCDESLNCPWTMCRCNDDAVILTSTCLAQACTDNETICGDRCEGHDGLGDAFGNAGQGAQMPRCDRFCARLHVSGCEAGCDPYFDSCESTDDCSVASTEFHECLTEQSVMTCEDGAVVMTGCVFDELQVCSAASL